MLLVRSATSFAANQQRRSLLFGNGWVWVNGRQQGRKPFMNSGCPKVYFIYCCVWFSLFINHVLSYIILLLKHWPERTVRGDTNRGEGTSRPSEHWPKRSVPKLSQICRIAKCGWVSVFSLSHNIYSRTESHATKPSHHFCARGECQQGQKTYYRIIYLTCKLF